MPEDLLLVAAVLVVVALAAMAAALWSERRAKWAAEEAQGRFAAMMQATGFGLLIVDADGRLVFVNQAAGDILGYPPTQMVGQHRHVLRHHEQAGEIASPGLDEALDEHRSFVGRDHFVDIRGYLVPVMVSTAPLPGDRGGNAVVFRDRSTEEAEERQRRDAIAMISHELRSPLTSVVGFSGRLERALREGWEVDAERAEEIALLAQEARRMRDIVTVVLDVSNLERHIAIEPEPLLLRDLIDEEVERIAREQPGATVVRDGDADAVVESDERFVRRILQNLLENAIKYGGSAQPVEVTVVASREGYDIRVRDHGPGIAPEVQDHIFDRFYRGPDTEQARRGLGLGLFLSRQLAALLGGHIGVESTVGQGATFTLWLPPTPPATSPITQEASTAGGRLLW
jgi:two-component system, OmpR family, phosphate regulon sensor histidine kinase PhoR